MKELTIKYTGENRKIQYLVNVLARRNGWKKLTDEEIASGVVQQTKEEAALEYVTSFINENIRQQNLKEIRKDLARQAAEAEALAISETNLELQGINKILEVIEIPDE